MLLVLTTLAIAAFPSSSLPQQSPSDNQPLPDKETDVAKTSVDANDGDDVEKNFADYIRLCNTLGIRPVGPSYATSPYYTNYGGNSGRPSNYAYPGYNGNSGYGGNIGYSNTGYSGYTGTRYPSYYPTNYGGSVYYRGNNAAGRSGETEITKESSDEDVEEKYKEYLKLCNTLGVPSSSLVSGAYTTYGGYGGSSNYGYPSYGYPSYGNTGYVVNPGYGGGYGSYSYPANYNVNPVYYRGRGNAAGRSDEVEATVEKTEKLEEEDVRARMFDADVSGAMKDGANRIVLEPSYVNIENLRFGRMAFKGMNAEIESMMAEHAAALASDSKEADVDEAEMASRLSKNIAKKF